MPDHSSSLSRFDLFFELIFVPIPSAAISRMASTYIFLSTVKYLHFPNHDKVLTFTKYDTYQFGLLATYMISRCRWYSRSHSYSLISYSYEFSQHWFYLRHHFVKQCVA